YLSRCADASRQVLRWQSVEGKRSFPHRLQLWISQPLYPSGLFRKPAQSPEEYPFERKRPFRFPLRSRISRLLSPCVLFLRSAQWWRRFLSLRRFASRWPQASPRSRLAFLAFLVRPSPFFQRPFSLLPVSPVPLVAAQKRLQPEPATHLLVNW